MNMRFLLTFVWVARLGSFRLTAEKLSTTQAAISSRISVLETELGVQLFLRDSRGVSLTREGHKVLGYAEEMLATQQRLQQSLGLADSFAGRLRIGVMDTVIHSWLSELISALSRDYPQVEVELTADTALNLSEQLLKGQLDLVFQTDLLRADGVRNVQLASYPLSWVVARAGAQDRSYASLADLCQERLLTFSRHSRPHQDMLNFLHQHAIAAPRVSCINSVAAIIKLVADGFGIGALPPVLVSRELQSGAMIALPIEAAPGFSVYASWRAGAGLELNEAVVNLSQAVVAEYQRSVSPAHFVLPHN
ncbi:MULTISPECIES: LysR family transcriptional regulator [Pseudomonas]|jgi:DNA-binding transcriptional LysR family regulator|uniref:LysR family transcriptional regulator n=1 Tax=Pseudomonas TaxID=286 RepID=UPI00028A010C|nr:MULTISPECIES: LysR family transcriptional regulator [Pseudomonas]AMB80137.1 LysR family transcriptional regulator [Pseudomonas fragi]NBF15614.1 LysR family transcriptional regulator [Pseudomonas sp. Fl4BN2]NNG63396.1 LysR family transcriptional regulator [Pseudomonas sp. GC01]AUB75852.1 LysR family transcriptional regulator [Pseudomonas sp. Lz4W]MCH4870727.1 LysR family transcriptional regulator [Pseudomonas sp. TMW22089]